MSYKPNVYQRREECPEFVRQKPHALEVAPFHVLQQNVGVCELVMKPCAALF